MEKNIRQAAKMPYEAPHVEVVSVSVEKGFAASSDNITHSYNDVYLEDANDGGIPWSTLMRD